MNLWIAVLSALVGYFLGAISFTRLIARWAAPGEDLTTTTLDFGESDSTFETKSVSATSLAIRKGPKAGCITSLLDIAKALIPTYIFWYLFPGENYFLITSASAVGGHNFPVYYGFKGGRGMSPLYGGLLVIDWVSIPVTAIGGSLLGLVLLRDMFMAYTIGVLLLIPWLWYRFNDPAYVLYAVFVNLMFWAAIWPELNAYLDNRKNQSTGNVDLRTFIQSARSMWLDKDKEHDRSSENETISNP